MGEVCGQRDQESEFVTIQHNEANILALDYGCGQ